MEPSVKTVPRTVAVQKAPILSAIKNQEIVPAYLD